MNKLIIASVMLVALVGSVRAELDAAQTKECLRKLFDTANSLEVSPRIQEASKVVFNRGSTKVTDTSKVDEMLEKWDEVQKEANEQLSKLELTLPGEECFDDENFGHAIVDELKSRNNEQDNAKINQLYEYLDNLKLIAWADE